MFKFFKKLYRLVFVEPDTIVAKFRKRVLKARQEAFSSRWPEMPVESMIFDDSAYNAAPPMNREQVVQRLRANRLGLSLASRLQQRNAARGALLLASFFVLMSATSLTGLLSVFSVSEVPQFARIATAMTWTVITLLSFWYMLGLSPTGTALLLPKAPILTDGDINDADQFTRRVLVHSTEGAPADLADRWRVMAVDANGEPVDGQILPGDYRDSYVKQVLDSAWIYYGAVFISALGVAAATWAGVLAGPMASALAFILPSIGTTALGVAFIVALARLFYLPDIAERRAAIAQRAVESSPSARLVEEVGREVFTAIETGRTQQRKRASADDSAFVQLGNSTGTLAARRDGYAPTEILPFGLTINDMSTHLFVFGDTGTGKTAGVLRPVLTCWLDKIVGGVVVLDGKGALPRELADDKRFQLISPETASYNPLSGLSPDDIANTLFEQNMQPDAKDPQWQEYAAQLIRAASVTMQALNELDSSRWPWTMRTLATLCEKQGYKAIRDVFSAEEVEQFSPYRKQAMNFFLSELPSWPNNMGGSVYSTAGGWIKKITDTEKLESWVDCERSDTDILEALTGAALAFDLPESEYGPAGPALSAMVKAQLYRAVKIRGDFKKALQNDENQTPVMVMIDEFQEVVSPDDGSMLPIARSLGVCVVGASQAVDKVFTKLGDYETDALFSQFRSIVSLNISSLKTRELVAERMGASYRSRVYSVSATHSDAHSMQVSATRTPGGFTSGSQGHEAFWRSDVAGELRVSHGIASELAVGLRKAVQKPMAELADALPVFRQRNDNEATHHLAKDKNVEADEVATLTSPPFYALAAINRAGVPRRDVIVLNPMFEFAPTAEDTEETPGVDVEVLAQTEEGLA